MTQLLLFCCLLAVASLALAERASLSSGPRSRMNWKAFCHRGRRGFNKNGCQGSHIVATALASPASNAIQKPSWQILQDTKQTFNVVRAKLEAGAVSGMVGQCYCDFTSIQKNFAGILKWSPAI